MEIADYQTLLVKTSLLKPDFIKAFRVLGYVSTITALSVYLSLSDTLAIWFMGQVLYGFSVLQWFILMHDFGHNCFFKKHRLNLNWFFGYISSLICLVPFAPWKWIHSRHHTWTGWHDLDPTQEATLPSGSTPLKNFLANWSWRLFLPVLTLSFSFKNFWNLPRLFRLFKDKNKQFHFVLSIILPLSFLAFQIYFVPDFLKIWALGYYFFLVISDPLLISQHVHIPQKFSGNAPVSPFGVKDQDQFTRTLLFPKWISRYILLSFDKHALHHVVPRLACYHLKDIHHEFPNSMNWLEWLIKAKKTPAHTLLFSNNSKTGLNI